MKIVRVSATRLFLLVARSGTIFRQKTLLFLPRACPFPEPLPPNTRLRPNHPFRCATHLVAAAATSEPSARFLPTSVASTWKFPARANLDHLSCTLSTDFCYLQGFRPCYPRTHSARTWHNRSKSASCVTVRQRRGGMGSQQLHSAMRNRKRNPRNCRALPLGAHE